MPSSDQAWKEAAHAPRRVAIIGASENPDKVGGRPIRYMQRFGFTGDIFPINPSRSEVQGLRAFAHIRDVPECPDLAIVAVPSMAAVDAVRDCAEAGVKLAVVITSGFGEVNDAGRALQNQMLTLARSNGMRLIGPNTQGIANFKNGAVASFATMFSEISPADGPIAIVSQSGAMSVVPYAHLRKSGLGVRYSHATGNEADLTVADLTECVLADSDIKLILLYLETIQDPQALRKAAELAHRRDVPILALKAGRSARGAIAAQSHTGALSSEDRVVDSFLRQIGIVRVADMHDLVSSAELLLSAKKQRSRKLLVVSNSGASCVMAADMAEDAGLELPELSASVKSALREVLPPFATPDNPIDLTGALLSNSAMFGQALDVLKRNYDGEQLLVSLPNAGAGYDVNDFAAAMARFSEETGGLVVACTPNPSSEQIFRSHGVVTFDHDSRAVAAFRDIARWNSIRAELDASAQQPQKRITNLPKALSRPPEGEQFASEAASLFALAECGLPIPRVVLCRTKEEARGAAQTIGGALVVKASSPDIPHKSELGLVRLSLHDPADVAHATEGMLEKVQSIGVRAEGIIVAEQVKGDIELLIGARRDPQFGVVVTIGAGGKYVEALDDVAVLLAPFSKDAALSAINSLYISRIFPALRGDPAVDCDALAEIMMQLANVLHHAHARVSSIDLNPVIVARGGPSIIADALIEYA